MHVLLPSKRNNISATSIWPPLDHHLHTDMPSRRFSLGIISLSERWSVPNFRRSSVITTTSTGVSMLQGAREHEEGESRGSSKRPTPPSSLRNQFKKFYISSVTTLSTNSIQTRNDNRSFVSSTSSSQAKSHEAPSKEQVHANWQPELPDGPIHLDCPHCHIQVQSVTDDVNGRLVWVASFILFLSTIVFACVPCCIPWLKDVQHRCPECHSVLGRHRRW
ncbi:LITAF-like zinc ribbon domain-containing protein [Umbelopsis sp. PMI_123]|nr:LITAF-like zinc ribbon domain-containing protein [Umbelopsis sp. PMI_123]